jgi:hypothetical protein
LLYASTEAQVWVSFDDGDHWQSLKLDMPAISVRDLQVKDDSVCMCADLVAATHGRGFWILDDITPLRQEASVRATKAAYLFKPVTAVRVRAATNDPTPWPPEVLAGENPPVGATIDYYLAAAAPAPVSLQILNASGTVIRTYSSNDRVLDPDPARDPEAYNKVCQQNPKAPDCALPLYWPAPTSALSTQAGMHRVSWDLRYNPIADEREDLGEDEGGPGAVPHRTLPSMDAPWAPPGAYTVRLTVGGAHYDQPLSLHLDPRVKTSPAALTQLATLSREMYDRAASTSAALDDARALAGKLEGARGAEAVTAKLKVLAPDSVEDEGRGRRRRGGEEHETLTFVHVRNALMGAAMAMQGADVAPTAAEVAACNHARGEYDKLMAQWHALRTAGLHALNAKGAAAGGAAAQTPP